MRHRDKLVPISLTIATYRYFFINSFAPYFLLCCVANTLYPNLAQQFLDHTNHKMVPCGTRIEPVYCSLSGLPTIYCASVEKNAGLKMGK